MYMNICRCMNISMYIQASAYIKVEYVEGVDRFWRLSRFGG